MTVKMSFKLESFDDDGYHIITAVDGVQQGVTTVPMGRYAQYKRMLDNITDAARTEQDQGMRDFLESKRVRFAAIASCFLDAYEESRWFDGY